jgi:hypothetical protein
MTSPRMPILTISIVTLAFASSAPGHTEEFTVDESWLSAPHGVEKRLAQSGTLAAQERAIIEEALRASGGRVYGRGPPNC